jgi:hypothetical protein
MGLVGFMRADCEEVELVLGEPTWGLVNPSHRLRPGRRCWPCDALFPSPRVMHTATHHSLGQRRGADEGPAEQNDVSMGSFLEGRRDLDLFFSTTRS